MSAGFTCEGREVCPQSRGYFREVLCGHLWVVPPPQPSMADLGSSAIDRSGTPTVCLYLWPQWLSALTPVSLPPPLLAGSFLSL